VESALRDDDDDSRLATAIGGIANDGMDDGLITRLVVANCKHADDLVVDDRDCRAAAANDGRVRNTSR